MPSATLELRTPEAEATGARSSIYRALGRAFCPPTPALFEEVRSGLLGRDLHQAHAVLTYELALPGDLANGLDGFAALESAYLALFEVGGPQGGPCFLYEGEYGGGRIKVMDEALRFYHYFGLRLEREQRDRPDHLATELEFMHALTFREASGLVAARAVDPLRKAERDFLHLHLQPFVSGVAVRLQDSGALFYPALADCAARFCQQELAYLEGGS